MEEPCPVHNLYGGTIFSDFIQSCCSIMMDSAATLVKLASTLLTRPYLQDQFLCDSIVTGTMIFIILVSTDFSESFSATPSVWLISLLTDKARKDRNLLDLQRQLVKSVLDEYDRVSICEDGESKWVQQLLFRHLQQLLLYEVIWHLPNSKTW